MWHLTCGDLAADSVRPLLADGSEVRVLRDDLAVGPLADIDIPPCGAAGLLGGAVAGSHDAAAGFHRHRG